MAKWLLMAVISRFTALVYCHQGRQLMPNCGIGQQSSCLPCWQLSLFLPHDLVISITAKCQLKDSTGIVNRQLFDRPTDRLEEEVQVCKCCCDVRFQSKYAKNGCDQVYVRSFVTTHLVYSRYQFKSVISCLLQSQINHRKAAVVLASLTHQINAFPQMGTLQNVH